VIFGLVERAAAASVDCHLLDGLFRLLEKCADTYAGEKGDTASLRELEILQQQREAVDDTGCDMVEDEVTKRED